MENVFIKRESLSKPSGNDLKINIGKIEFPKKYLIFLLISNLLAFLMGSMNSKTLPIPSEKFMIEKDQTLLELKVINYSVANIVDQPTEITIYRGKQRIIEHAILHQLTQSEDLNAENASTATIAILNNELKQVITNQDEIFSIYPYYQSNITETKPPERQYELIF